MQEPNLVEDEKVKKDIYDIATEYKKNVYVEVKRAATYRPLQTNDYVAGSLGKKYNHNEQKYIDRLNVKVCRAKLKSKR